MLRRRPHQPILGWFGLPRIGWVALAVVYLISAMLSLFLQISMSVWWPLVLAVVSAAASAGCLAAAIGSRRA